MVVAIVLAGGSGKRMHSDVKKQYMELHGKPLITYALEAFSSASCVDRIVLVTGAEDVEYCRESIVKANGYTKVKDVVPGGAERYDSVRQGLYALHDELKSKDIILIHDGARPLVTVEMIETSVETAEEVGACTVGVPVKDTIKVVDEAGFGIDTPPRSSLYQIQTPQTFTYEVIHTAYELLSEDPIGGITDDTMLVEHYLGRKVKVIPGDLKNIKITTPEDLLIAESFLK